MFPTDFLRSAARCTPGRLALVEPRTNRREDFETLDERVDELVQGLDRIGVEAGDRVVIEGRLSAAVVELVHAIGRIGGIVVPLDPSLSAHRFRTRVDRVNPSTVVSVSDAYRWGSGHAVHPIETIRDSGVDAPSSTPPGPTGVGVDDTVCILFTSGTTGTALPVRLTAGNLLLSAFASALRLGVEPTDRWLACLPPHHMGGFAPIVRTVAYGTGLVVHPFDPSEFVRLIPDQRVRLVSLVPLLLRRALDGNVPLDALRVVLVGGDRVPSSIVERALGRGVPVYATYGMTETASQVATATPTDLSDRSDTAGRPLPWTNVSIVDRQGRECPVGESGEIVVEGPTVSPGYFGDPASIRSDAGFHTGDVGRIDESGRVFVIGRLDDRIVSGGVTVDPQSVERVLCTVEGVAAAVVVGVPDPEWGERVCALLEVAPEHSLDPETVLSAVGDELSAAERPRAVAVTSTIPRTPSGTVDRSVVRARFEEHETE